MTYLHTNQPRVKKLMVRYTGTDKIYAGEAVCYDSDRGTATDANAERCHFVERPTVSNSQDFAGVSVATHAADSGGQFIEIYEPGSKSVPVALGVDTVIGTGLLTFAVKGRYNIGVTTGLGTEAGRFHSGRYRGRGAAIPRQTVTALLEDGTAGGWSIAADGLTLTMTATAGLAAGDTVVLLGGEDDATGTVIPGKYVIASITSATVLVLTAPSSGATAVDVTTTALTCTGYAYTANPTALCDLLDGEEESGGCEFISLPNAGVVGVPYMAWGLSYVCGGVTLAADCDVTFAQGTFYDQRKGFICLGTLTTNDFTVDLATNGLTLAAGALAEFNAIDAALDACYLVYGLSQWASRGKVGGATEA